MSSAPETRTPETPAAETPTAETLAAETRTFETRVGTVVGRVDGDVVRVLGVPYAVAERFEAPRPAPPAVGDDGQPVPFLAFERAPASPQLASPAMQVLFDDAAGRGVELAACGTLVGVDDGLARGGRSAGGRVGSVLGHPPHRGPRRPSRLAA